MSKYYQENFESYLESYKEEVKVQVELMKIFDDEIVCGELPPVSKTKELFEIMETIKYDTDSRYKKKNAIPDTHYNLFAELEKDEFFSEMRNILREEVALFFSQNKANDWT